MVQVRRVALLLVVLGTACSERPRVEPPPSTIVVLSSGLLTAQAQLTAIAVVTPTLVSTETSLPPTVAPIVAPKAEVGWALPATKIGSDALNLAGAVPRGRNLRLMLSNGTEITIDENSEFTLAEGGETSNRSLTRIGLAGGQLWANLKGGSLEVETPIGIATVRGSMLGISFSAEDQYIGTTCMEGTVVVEAGGEQIVVPPGKRAETHAAGTGPEVTGAMEIEELVNWAMNVSDSIAVMPEVVPQDAIVSMAIEFPVEESRGREALGTLLDVVPPETMWLAVESLPPESIGAAVVVLNRRDPDNERVNEVVEVIPEEKLSHVVETMLDAPEAQSGVVQLIELLPQQKLQKVVTDLPDASLGALVGALRSNAEPSDILMTVVNQIPVEKLSGMVAALSQDPERSEDLIAVIDVLPDDNLATVLEDLATDSESEPAFRAVAAATSEERLKTVMEGTKREQGGTLVEMLENAVRGVVELFTPPTQPVAPSQPPATQPQLVPQPPATAPPVTEPQDGNVEVTRNAACTEFEARFPGTPCP